MEDEFTTRNQNRVQVEDWYDYLDTNSPISTYLVEIEDKFWDSRANKNYIFPRVPNCQAFFQEEESDFKRSTIGRQSTRARSSLKENSKSLYYDSRSGKYLKNSRNLPHQRIRSAHSSKSSADSLHGITSYNLHSQNVKVRENEKNTSRSRRSKKSINYSNFNEQSNIPGQNNTKKQNIKQPSISSKIRTLSKEKSESKNLRHKNGQFQTSKTPKNQLRKSKDSPKKIALDNSFKSIPQNKSSFQNIDGSWSRGLNDNIDKISNFKKMNQPLNKPPKNSSDIYHSGLNQDQNSSNVLKKFLKKNTRAMKSLGSEFQDIKDLQMQSSQLEEEGRERLTLQQQQSSNSIELQKELGLSVSQIYSARSKDRSSPNLIQVNDQHKGLYYVQEDADNKARSSSNQKGSFTSRESYQRIGVSPSAKNESNFYFGKVAGTYNSPKRTRITLKLKKFLGRKNEEEIQRQEGYSNTQRRAGRFSKPDRRLVNGYSQIEDLISKAKNTNNKSNIHINNNDNSTQRSQHETGKNIKVSRISNVGRTNNTNIINHNIRNSLKKSTLSMNNDFNSPTDHTSKNIYRESIHSKNYVNNVSSKNNMINSISSYKMDNRRSTKKVSKSNRRHGGNKTRKFEQKNDSLRILSKKLNNFEKRNKNFQFQSRRKLQGNYSSQNSDLFSKGRASMKVNNSCLDLNKKKYKARMHASHRIKQDPSRISVDSGHRSYLNSSAIEGQQLEIGIDFVRRDHSNLMTQKMEENHNFKKRSDKYLIDNEDWTTKRGAISKLRSSKNSPISRIFESKKMQNFQDSKKRGQILQKLDWKKSKKSAIHLRQDSQKNGLLDFSNSKRIENRNDKQQFKSYISTYRSKESKIQNKAPQNNQNQDRGSHQQSSFMSHKLYSSIQNLLVSKKQTQVDCKGLQQQVKIQMKSILSVKYQYFRQEQPLRLKDLDLSLNNQIRKSSPGVTKLNMSNHSNNNPWGRNLPSRKRESPSKERKPKTDKISRSKKWLAEGQQNKERLFFEEFGGLNQRSRSTTVVDVPSEFKNNENLENNRERRTQKNNPNLPNLVLPNLRKMSSHGGQRRGSTSSITSQKDRLSVDRVMTTVHQLFAETDPRRFISNTSSNKRETANFQIQNAQLSSNNFHNTRNSSKEKRRKRIKKRKILSKNPLEMAQIRDRNSMRESPSPSQTQELNSLANTRNTRFNRKGRDNSQEQQQMAQTFDSFPEKIEKSDYLQLLQENEKLKKLAELKDQEINELKEKVYSRDGGSSSNNDNLSMDSKNQSSVQRNSMSNSSFKFDNIELSTKKTRRNVSKAIHNHPPIPARNLKHIKLKKISGINLRRGEGGKPAPYKGSMTPWNKQHKPRIISGNLPYKPKSSNLVQRTGKRMGSENGVGPPRGHPNLKHLRGYSHRGLDQGMDNLRKSKNCKKGTFKIKSRPSSSTNPKNKMYNNSPVPESGRYSHNNRQFDFKGVTSDGQDDQNEGVMMGGLGYQNKGPQKRNVRLKSGDKRKRPPSRPSTMKQQQKQQKIKEKLNKKNPKSSIYDEINFDEIGQNILIPKNETLLSQAVQSQSDFKEKQIISSADTFGGGDKDFFSNNIEFKELPGNPIQVSKDFFNEDDENAIKMSSQEKNFSSQSKGPESFDLFNLTFRNPEELSKELSQSRSQQQESQILTDEYSDNSFKKDKQKINDSPKDLNMLSEKEGNLNQYQKQDRPQKVERKLQKRRESESRETRSRKEANRNKNRRKSRSRMGGEGQFSEVWQ